MPEPGEITIHLDGPGSVTHLLDAVDALPFGLAVVDGRGVVVATNRAWRTRVAPSDHITGVQKGDDLRAHLARAHPARSAVAEHVADGLARVLDGRSESFEFQYEEGGGDTERWYLVSFGALPQGGAVVTRQETTLQHSVQDLLSELAFHDPLTSLPNRSLVLDRLRLAQLRSGRTGTRPAVVFFDLNGFKEVNDRQGHEVGDQLLVQVAQRLRHSFRDGDTCGRWGGDEFVVVVELEDAGHLQSVIGRTLHVFEQPFRLEGTELALHASLGVAVARPEERAQAVVRRADEAMYTAKRSGAGVWIAGADEDLGPEVG